jgi:hypothetical protein
MAKEPETELICQVCDNPCDDTISMSEQSIEVDGYSWICYDPDSPGQTAYLHE